MTDLQDRVDGYWNSRARDYDAAQQARAEVDAELWSGVWGPALGTAPQRVLDLGTGSGHAAFVISSLGHDVTGVDASTEMLRIASDRATGRANAPTFLHGDAVDPAATVQGPFDAVVSRYVMWTLRDPVAALRAWRDLLTPQGRLAVVDSTWFDTGLDGSADEFVEAYGQIMERLPLAGAQHIEATAQAVRDAGFRDVEVRPLTEVLEVDRREGVMPGHEPRLQFLVSARV